MAYFKKIATGILLAGMALTCSGQSIYISELMADNSTAHFDEDGDSPDWIELYNYSASSVDLTGWYLTDDSADPTQWMFPATNIPSKGFLVVFASNKDRAVSGSELHTNFKLSADGEYVALIEANGKAVETEITFGALEEDTSFGYDFSGGEITPSNTGLMTNSTPGAANDTLIYQGYVETPIVSPERGFYDSPFSVTVSNITAGATIYYTTDGTEPTTSDTEYTGPISITTTANLRVKAFKSGWKASYPRTDTYIFVDEVAATPKSTYTIPNLDGEHQEMREGMDQNVVDATYHDASNQVVSVQDSLKAIPTISITTADDNLFDRDIGIYVNATQIAPTNSPLDWERAASVEWILPDGSEGFHINAGLRIRGGHSRMPDYPKHGFRLFFRDDYGEGRLKYDFFDDGGITSFEKLDLRTTQGGSWASAEDPNNTMLRDIFGRDSALDMGTICTRSAYCHVYLNGEYWGLYMTEERPDNNFGADYFGGDDEDYDIVKVWREYDNSDGFWIENPPPEGNLDAYRELYDAAMAGLGNDADYFAIQGMNASGESDPTLTRLLDVENMIDYLLLIYYVAGVDNGIMWYNVFGDGTLNNIYGLYNRVTPDGFKWIQHDLEMTMDHVVAKWPGDLNRTGPFTGSGYSNFQTFEYFNPQTLHEKLTVNDEYKLKFADRVYKHFKGDGALIRTNCEARLAVRQAEIDRAIVAHSARWGSTSLDRDTWENAVDGMYDFLARGGGDRCDEVIGYLNADGLIPSTARPEFSFYSSEVAAGTNVTISASAGTIYYTMDGSDPRAIGGGIAGSTYSGPITITRPTHLKARAYSGGEWSALTDATYWTPEIPLKVTEVMYHAASSNQADFIEIQNVSAETVTMKGYKFDNAIDFKFKNGPATLAAGEYMVVVDNIAGFSANYDTNGIIIGGEYSGDLSNGGEKVDLEFRNKDMIGFTYNDARDWPQQADGAGHSLVPIDSAMAAQESGSLDYGGNWRASTYIGGSPGEDDPASPASVVLNEITAHTDTGLAVPNDSNDKIELYNPTASAIDISGWHLSDDADELEKFTIPTTVIPAGGFVIFDEDDFHTDRTNGFGLNKAGEQVYLSSSDRVVDSIRFKGQENGVAYGRYPDGAADWVTTTDTTAGSANQTVDPEIWISELMYNPTQPGNDYEYIKLKNMSSSTIAFENATGTYRIDGGVEFDFPDGVSLGAGEELWVLSYNPTNTTKLNLFCSAYGLVAANETFIGGYGGSLSDSGERVSLERPQDSDDPLNTNDISWVIVDEVVYFDQDPWPTSADGTGYPLVRNGSSDWIVPADLPIISVSTTEINQQTTQGYPVSDSTFEVWNGGPDTLNYSVSTADSWLSVSPTSGSSTGQHDTVTLTYDTDLLAAGSYTGIVEITSADSFYEARNIRVILDVQEQVLDHFSWKPIGDEQVDGRPFSATLTAINQHGDTLQSFNGTASLSATRGDLPPGETTIGTGTIDWEYPMHTYYHDSRTQVIYLQSEIGEARTISSLALYVETAPELALNNWTIRMRHTSLNSYESSPSWETDWSIVYQDDVTVSSTGWLVFNFSTPFNYNGTDNLMIDFSQNNTAWEDETRGRCYATETGSDRSYWGRSDSGHGDPLNWSGSSTPNLKDTSSYVPSIRLTSPIDSSVTISPTTTGSFTDGVWSGMVTVDTLATNVVLTADDGSGHSADSNPFNVVEYSGPDMDGDGMPDQWELDYFGTTEPANPDMDFDGQSNLEEYVAHTDPTNAASLFIVDDLVPPALYWTSATGRIYSVWWTDDLGIPFSRIASNLTAGSYSDEQITNNPVNFYQIEVKLEP